MTDVKPWYQSKTLWVNLIILALALIDAGTGNDWVAQHVSESPRVAQAVAGMVAVLNLALRLLTGKPIEGSPADKDALLRESGMIR